MKQVTLDLYELMASANNGLTRVFESMRLNQEGVMDIKVH